MATVIKVAKYDCVADFLEHSNTKVLLASLTGGNYATAFEYIGGGEGVEGVILYVPGVTVKQLKAKK